MGLAFLGKTPPTSGVSIEVGAPGAGAPAGWSGDAMPALEGLSCARFAFDGEVGLCPP